jgi:cytohesin
MKHLLLTTIAAVVLVGCGESQQSAPTPEAKPVEPVAEAAKPEPPTAKAPDISILDAAFGGNIEAVKQHIAAGADVNAKYEGWTPLHTAVEGGHKEIVELLIANGADVNPKDNWGKAPLHNAAQVWIKVNTEVVELLIAEGADVNAKGEVGLYKGKTPLDQAIAYKRTETADLLRKHGGKTGAELKAAGKPAEPVAEAAKPEPPTAIPVVSIHDAAKKGNLEAVKKHLADGADVNAKDDAFGTTPLHRAAYYGHKEIVVLLIAAETDVNPKNVLGTTPLHQAAARGHKEVVELLIAADADVNAKKKDGWTPLHSAAFSGRKEIAELLIANGVDVNAKVASSLHKGKTPLDAANETNHPETADLLRKHGGKTGEELKAEGK